MALPQPFDDRDGEIWVDGKFVPWREANVHVLTHGLHYASSVFEGVRAYGGKVFKMQEHNERLIKSAQLLDFEIPYTVDELNKATLEVVKRSGFSDCYIRPVAWRGSEMMAIAAQHTKIHVAIAAWQWPKYFAKEDLLKGLRLTFSKWQRPDPKSAPTASKAAGLYMICTMSKNQAEADGFNDALMLDYRGYLAEATGANLFLIQNGEVHTPKPDCFLDGITRRTVMDLARARGLKVIERHIKPEELANTQEVFLTGTAAEVSPVSEIDDYRFQVGRITQDLMGDYEKLVRA